MKTNSSVQRAINVLELFTRLKDSYTLTEISKKLNVNPATLMPVLHTLEKNEYLERDQETKKYSLGIKLMELGQLVSFRYDIRNRADKILRELLMEIGLTIHLAIMEKGEIIYIDRKEASSKKLNPSWIGKRAPLHSTALGKALLAFSDSQTVNNVKKYITFEKFTEHTITSWENLNKQLKEVRKQGYAIDNEEHQKGGLCVGAPIFNHDGEVIAAISTSMIKSNTTDKKIKKVIQSLKKAAQDISISMGFNENS